MLIKSKLILNFFFLAIGQGTTFLVPLLLAPFLIKKVGIGNYGLIISAQAIMSYFSVFTDYGFNLTAVKECSVNRDNKNKLNTIITDVFITKLTLLLLSTIVIIIVYIYSSNKLLLLSFALVIGKVLSPNWFFQGVEKMYLLALFSVLSKVLGAFLIFFYVHTQQDYIWINFFFALGDIVFSVWGLVQIYISLNLFPVTPNIDGIKQQIKEGYAILITNFANNIYLNSNIIILSFFASPQIIGQYAVAEKIMVTVKQIAVVLLQSTYSHACYLAEKSFNSLKDFLRKELFFMGIFFLILSILLILFAKSIVKLFVSDDINEIVFYVSMLSFVPLIVSLNMPAYKMLIIKNQKKGYLTIVLLGAIINLLLNLILGFYFKGLGTVITVLITEIFITIGFYWFLKTKRDFSFL